MQRARFKVSEELLRQALHMPDTSTIVNIRMEPDFGYIVVIADDRMLPVSAHPIEAEPTVTAQYGGTEWDTTYVWNWNIDEDQI